MGVRTRRARPPAAYDFTIDRRKQRPLEYLGDYTGYIHADAYSGYEELFAKESVVKVACRCHARRGFDEAMSSPPPTRPARSLGGSVSSTSTSARSVAKRRIVATRTAKSMCGPW